MCKKTLLGAVDDLQRELLAPLHKLILALMTFNKVRNACQKLGDTFLQLQAGIHAIRTEYDTQIYSVSIKSLYTFECL